MTQPATHELVQGCILDKRKMSMNSETDRYIQLANCFFVAAEKELSAFMSAVLKLFGPEQARQSALRWIEELERMDSPSGESIPDWRRATVLASARLALWGPAIPIEVGKDLASERGDSCERITPRRSQRGAESDSWQNK
jgi:hypothetical protein